MLSTRLIALVALCGIASAFPSHAPAQQDDARALVQSIVTNELGEDANDHSHWMFRDANKENGKDTVKLVVQTAQGDLSKTIEINGQPLTPQQEQQDKMKMHRFVTDAAVRQKQKQNNKQDDEKAASLTRMLPDAFLWTKVGESGDDTTLEFRPNPNFTPPTREARVFAAMKGTMVVNTKQKRIQSLKGSLIRNVNFGLGLLGKLEKGGTFNVERRNVERRNVGRDLWEITETHVHIHGHALIFKSIGEEQDEETSGYKPVPASMTLEKAEKMLNDKAVAKKIGVKQP